MNHKGNMKNKGREKKEVEMEYFFKKIGDAVYQYRRFDKGEWERILTSFREKPFISSKQK